MSIQSEELARYFRLRGIRNVDIVEQTGVDKGTVSNLLNGSRPVSFKTAKKIADVYGLSAAFIAYGEGTLMPASRQDAPADNFPAPSSSAEPAGLEAENRALHNEVAELTREKITLKARIYQLIDRLEKHGIPCGEKE